MAKKMINSTVVEGRIYENNLALKVTGETAKVPGTEYIGGSLDIATDDAGLNIVTVHFTYVTATTKAGAVNNTFTVLKNIIDNSKTILKDGMENATMVHIDSAIGLNDFYTNRNGEEVLVSAKRNDGGFVKIINKLNEDETKRNTFTCDMLITGTTFVEANEEKQIAEDYLVVKGAAFNFRNSLLPVEFTVKGKGGISYFESLEAKSDNPVFTKVWGIQNSQTVIRRQEEESAFGQPEIKEFTRTVREWLLTGAAKEPYDFGDAETAISADEVRKAMADREIYLADVKKKADEYKANKAAATPSVGVTAAAGSFTF